MKQSTASLFRHQTLENAH